MEDLTLLLDDHHTINKGDLVEFVKWIDELPHIDGPYPGDIGRVQDVYSNGPDGPDEFEVVYRKAGFNRPIWHIDGEIVRHIPKEKPNAQSAVPCSEAEGSQH